MVAKIGDEVEFVAVKAGISPVPFAARLIEVVLFVQLKMVPDTAEPPNATGFVCEPLHTTWLAGAVPEGVGLTVILKDLDGPGQPTPPFE